MQDQLLRVKYGSIQVFYKVNLGGGGNSFGQDFIPVVKRLFRHVGRVCEFGAGPGFIGFSLLANGLCDSLCLVDVNPEAIKLVRQTVAYNQLEDKVAVYLSDGLRQVARDERWDLVVSNPPFFNGTQQQRSNDIKAFDPDWKIHREFYATVPAFLTSGGFTLFVESEYGSNSEIWKEMILNSGLDYVRSFKSKSTIIWGLIIWGLLVSEIKYNGLNRALLQRFLRYLGKGKMVAVLHRERYPFYFVLGRSRTRLNS